MFSQRFRSLNIGRRLLMLILAMAITIGVVGVSSLIAMSSASGTVTTLQGQIDRGVVLTKISHDVRSQFVDVANSLYRGTTVWAEANNTIQASRNAFKSDWAMYLDQLSNEERDKVSREFNDALVKLNQAYDAMLALGEQQSRGQLELFMLNDLDYLSTPFITKLQKQIVDQRQLAENYFSVFSTRNTIFVVTLIALFTAGIGLSIFLGWTIRRSIVDPLNQVMGTVQQVNEGDYDARTQLKGTDEIAELSTALDSMLDARVTALVEKERENDRLNDSIIRLLEATSQLGDRDLTVTVPVSEDVTGPIADSMNLVATETARVLMEIRQVANRVESSARNVRQQSERVSEVAAKERGIIETATERLEVASKAMLVIAKLCQTSDNVAKQASTTTEQAFSAVQLTVNGMNEIRESISESEKRIKRLGERSQEISGIVDIINNIAERTHVLALNASMHAAAAGEAGRGFAVVADEVQRLAESSRGATSQISSLVKTIQSETGDAINTMNRTISEVVEGSKRAEQAGEQMRVTQDTTSELVASVAQISDRALKQVKVNEALRQIAAQIENSTHTTDAELQRQSADTESLVQFASELLSSVEVFKLPGHEQPHENASAA
ncbi:MAG: methyl-accepting chemotaxis protein [Pseudomonadales bacterium]|nr:methyl-accepting chemotaxis protein [Pseudomonadales bacterium]